MNNLQNRILNLCTLDSDGCWVWKGSFGSGGYGKITVNGMTRTSHSASYVAFIGEIKEGLEIDHLCRNKYCVNPFHLEAVTHSVNCKRAQEVSSRAMSNKCKHGHDLNGVRTRPSGGRYCKTCVRNNKRRQRSKYI